MAVAGSPNPPGRPAAVNSPDTGGPKPSIPPTSRRRGKARQEETFACPRPADQGNVGLFGAQAILFEAQVHTKRSNPALNLAPFGRWKLRDKAAQRRLALR